MRTEWPGRPTRLEVLRPRGLRERLVARIGLSLLERWDKELGAETMRADAGWEALAKMQSERS